MGSSSDGDEVAVRAAPSDRSPRLLRRRLRGREDEIPVPSPPKEKDVGRSAATIDGGEGKKLLNLVSRALTAALLAALAATVLLSSSFSSPSSSPRRPDADGSSPSSSSSSSSSLLFDPIFDSSTGLTLPPPSIWDPKAKPNASHYSSLRQEAREWFASTFDLYLERAFPRDDLKPLSCSGADSQGGIALTRLDAMTTALMLGDVERLEGTVAWASRREEEPAAGTSLFEGDGNGGGNGNGNGGGGSGSKGRAAKKRGSSSSSPFSTLLRFDNKRGARVHVFELTIRAVGSLVSSHIYLKRGLLLEKEKNASSSSSSSPPSPLRFPSYDGVSLLNRALDLAERILPAFDTPTGLPLSWVHLTEEGDGTPPFSPRREKDRSTCAACAGTLLLEFAALSRESGDPRFELAAARAARSLHSRRSPKTGLVGNTIDVDSGAFIRRDSGVGAGIDSYYEYLLKSYLLTGQKEWLTAFVEAYTSAMRHCSPPIVLMLEKEEEEEGEEALEGEREEKGRHKKRKTKFTLRPRRKAWRIDSHVDTAAMTGPWISSLGAFWPGLQALAGQTVDASKSHADWAAAWSRFSGLPEAIDVSGVTRHPTLTGYPLRPELVESSFVLFGETKHESYLATGAALMETLRRRCRAECGFAALADVGDGGGRGGRRSSDAPSISPSAAAAAAAAASPQQDAMESFFLSETVKYLWLLFSAADAAEEGGGGAESGSGGGGFGSTARLLDGVVLTTEGHPLPPYPPSPTEEEESEPSSSPAPSTACFRLCSLSQEPSSSSISRSLSAAMPLLAPSERDVETLRRRRCLACLAVEEGMYPVREQWAQEMKGAEKAAALAMAKAEEEAAAMKAKAETKQSGSDGGGLTRASSASSSSSSSLSFASLDQSQLELFLQQQQRQQIQEQRQLLQQLQFLQQQQQQQQRPPVAQVLCRLQEVVASPPPSSTSSSSLSSSKTSKSSKSITCGSLSLVPREQMPIKHELVPAETLVLQVVQAGEEEEEAAAGEKEVAAAAAAGKATCPAATAVGGSVGYDGKTPSLPLPPREWRLRLRVSSEDRWIPPLSLSGYSAEFGPSLASAAKCKGSNSSSSSSSGDESDVDENDDDDNDDDDSSDDGRPCSVSGFLVAARPADACSSSSSLGDDLTFEPPVPPGQLVVVVVERGNCDFEAKVSAVARALPGSREGATNFSSTSTSTSTAAAAAAVIVLSGEDSHLSMGKSILLPSSELTREEPPIPSMLLPKSQADRLRSAMAQAGQLREAVAEARRTKEKKKNEEEEVDVVLLTAEREARRRKEKKSEEDEVDGVLLTAELRAMPEKTAAAKSEDERSSGGSGPPPPLDGEGEEEGGSSAPSPNLGTVTISALAPASAAAWLDEHGVVDVGRGAFSQGEKNSRSFVSGAPLQQLLASLAQSREFAALLQQVARERWEEGEEE